MRQSIQVLVVGVCLLLGGGVASAAVFQADDAPTFAESIANDLFTAGNTVSITAPIKGEIFAVGNAVTITKPAERSIYAGGNSVTIRDGAGYNVFASGNTVTLAGKIGHDVYAAGSTIVVEEGTEIMGDLHAVGASIVIKGTIRGSVDVAGASITSAAVIGGNFTAGQVEKLNFTDGAVAGDLAYTSRKDAQGMTKVTVTGKTVRHNPPVPTRENRNYSFMPFLFLVPMWFVLGLVLLVIMPNRLVDVEKDLRTNWGKQFLVGFGIVVVAFPLAIGLAITVIGLPLAALVGAVVFLLGIIAKGISGILLGRLLMRQVKMGESWWLAWLLGTLLAAIVLSIPVVGPLVFGAITIGLILPAMGSLAHGLWWNVRARS